MSLRDARGRTMASVRDGRIYDDANNAVYEIRGDRIYDISSRMFAYEIRDNRIYSASGGAYLYEIRDGRLYDFSNTKLGEFY